MARRGYAATPRALAVKSDIPQIFGGVPEADSPILGRLPQHLFEIEWQWLRPLRAILAFLGYSIDDVVSNPRAASEVRTLWKVYKLAQRLEREAAETRAQGEKSQVRSEDRRVRFPRRRWTARRRRT